jgi:putative nucleotidyltransferase with HDIG domain
MPFKKTKLKNKLFMTFFFLALIPVILTTTIVLWYSQTIIDNMSKQQADSSMSTLNSYFKIKEEQALSIVKRYSQDKDLIEIFEKRDRALLYDKCRSIYSSLNEDCLVTVFEFGDNKGNVFLRVHNPKQFGDSKAKNISIIRTLNGETTAGFEFGKSGLAIRAFVPIKKNNAIIGTFQVGYNFNQNTMLINKLYSLVSNDISLYDNDTMFSTSNSKNLNKIGKKLQDSSIFKQVSSGKSLYLFNKQKVLNAYFPVCDPQGKNIYGMIEVSQDLSKNQELKNRVLILVIILCIFILLISIVVSFSLSKRITDPLSAAINAFKEVSDGNLNVYINERNYSSDEARILLNSLKVMIGNIRGLINEKERLMAEAKRSHYNEIQEGYLQTVIALANSIEAKDEYTLGHCQRLTEYSIKVAEKLELTENEMLDLKYSALLHDIGKIGIETSILHKPSKLTDDEYNEIKKHPLIAYNILRSVKFLEKSLDGIYQHHEWYNGRGYPNGLKGDEISLFGRILCVVDSYDAMTSDRPYRKGMEVEAALLEIKKNIGIQFDPQIADIFIKIVVSEHKLLCVKN